MGPPQSARPVTARAYGPRLGIGVTGKTSSDTRLTLGLTWLLWASRPPVGLVIASTTLHLRCTVSAIAYRVHENTSDGAREAASTRIGSVVMGGVCATGGTRVGKGLTDNTPNYCCPLQPYGWAFSPYKRLDPPPRSGVVASMYFMYTSIIITSMTAVPVGRGREST